MRPRRIVCSLLVTFTVVAAVAAPSGSATAEQTGEPCDAWDVEYALSARLQLSDTPHGAGNGAYAIGPGSTVLRFDNVNGQPGGTVRMRSYTMREHFEIDSHMVFWGAHVLTDSKTVVAASACGDVAKGDLSGGHIRWLTSMTGYRTDGSLTCDGSLCGTFGAPASGKSELHVPPHNVTFSAFEFAPDMKTFSMPSTFVAKTEDPKQTAHLALAGREVSRTCVRVPPCP